MGCVLNFGVQPILALWQSPLAGQALLRSGRSQWNGRFPQRRYSQVGIGPGPRWSAGASSKVFPGGRQNQQPLAARVQRFCPGMTSVTHSKPSDHLQQKLHPSADTGRVTGERRSRHSRKTNCLPRSDSRMLQCRRLPGRL